MWRFVFGHQQNVLKGCQSKLKQWKETVEIMKAGSGQRKAELRRGWNWVIRVEVSNLPVNL